MKRVMDSCAALLLLTLLSPVFIVVAIIVRFNIGAPILFKQQRPGLHGKPFYLYKFRTMNNEVDESGELLPDVIRLTKLGRFLRKYSLDELPQLFNVLIGDMSLVGPRPLLMEYLSLYTDEQFLRHMVKPGITGWAQINGRNNLSWDEKFRLDIWYVKNRGFLLDCKILLLTIAKVMKREGINHQGTVSMLKFEGSKSGEGI